MTLAERMAELRAEDDGHLLFDTARTLGDFRLVEPGCEIWAKTEGADARMRFDGEPRGGIVLEITETAEPDRDTGEITPRRAFRCYDYDYRTPPHQRISVLTEAQVDSFEPPNMVRIRSTWRRLCKEVAAKKGTAAPEEIDTVLDAARLAAIVGQRTR